MAACRQEQDGERGRLRETVRNKRQGKILYKNPFSKTTVSENGFAVGPPDAAVPEQKALWSGKMHLG